MQVDDLLVSIDPNVDYSQIAPVHQKHTIAFINQFTMQTVAFLNKFAQSCESRLMDFEYKLQKVEASLLILESQLSSISGLDNDENSNKVEIKTEESVLVELPEIVFATVKTNNEPNILVNKNENNGIKASEDPRYKKFFKMVHFGVPGPAVKIKMQNEGIDPNILDTPNEVIPGLENYKAPESDSDSSSI
ncbi:unnamed protein product [Brassicogethes aeneus]|uniref:WASH complex subunit 3 n=1 Tax=Brassicogethes aeneus TaxID=1431903 RepID=A0A9P0FKN4_BRAAE|nr:unnamed protein product [Brassicogethes aeneus]